MFTGLIQSKAQIQSVTFLSSGLRLSIVPDLQSDWSLGESIAINGVCLTLTSYDGKELQFDLSPETLQKTTAGDWKSGDTVNFERALKVGDSLGGHWVQGHIDGVAVVRGTLTEGKFWKVLVEIPHEFTSSLIPKGSITIDGVSLTINSVDFKNSVIELQLIPETLLRTNLSELKINSRVNFEIDLIVKTISQITRQQQQLREGALEL